MTTTTRPPIVPDSTCRSHAQHPDFDDEDARTDRVREGVRRRAERTVLQQEKIDVNFARQTQRQYLGTIRRKPQSAAMRAINELRAEVAVLAGRLGITPWPPATAAPDTGAAKTRARKRRRG